MNNSTLLSTLTVMMISPSAYAQTGVDTKVVVEESQHSLLLPAKEGCNLIFVNSDGMILGNRNLTSAESVSVGVNNAPKKATSEIMETPFTCDFSADSDLDLFTIIDANRDYKVWEYNYQNFVALMNNQWQAANDYLVSPGLNLKGGYLYTFSTDARPYQSAYPEKLELWVGTAPTAEGLTDCILPAVTLTEETWSTQSSDFMPETDGVYYFAVRGVSDADMYALLLNNFNVSDGISGLAPARPEFEAVRDPEGEPLATLKVTAPVVSLNGQSLNSIQCINLYRDGVKLHTFDNITPGETYTFVDENPSVDMHSYSAECINEEGAGPASYSKCFTGIYYAVWPEKVIPAVGENEGQVELNWTPCLTDQMGNPLRPDQVTYSIYRIHAGNVGLLVDGLTEPHYVDQVCGAEDFQRDVQYTVMANTSYGMSAGTGSGIFYAGSPYVLPYSESVTNGQLSSLMFSRGLANYAASWDIADMNDYDLPYPANGSDNDGGFLYHRAYNAGEKAQIGTAKVHIPADASSVKLSFDTYLNSSNQNTLEVKVLYQGEETELANVSQNGEAGWTSVSTDLSDFKGKTIQITWTNTVNTHILTAIDNIKVESADTPTAIESIGAENVDEVIYFNLQGIRIASPAEGQIVIEKKGNKTTRKLFRK